jgi:uncharacterized RDD family membrane protein YckC
MRVLATAFDMVVMLLVIMLVMVLADAQVWQVTVNSSAGIWTDVLTLITLVPFMYFVGCWAVFGASPGKMLLSLQVVDAETQGELSLGQCLLRYMGCVLNVLSFGFGIVGIFSATQPQGWHDRLAGTVVIRH